jgi:hypothetical protein
MLGVYSVPTIAASQEPRRPENPTPESTQRHVAEEVDDAGNGLV